MNFDFVIYGKQSLGQPQNNDVVEQFLIELAVLVNTNKLSSSPELYAKHKLVRIGIRRALLTIIKLGLVTREQVTLAIARNNNGGIKMRTTNIYTVNASGEKLIRSEKLCTLREFLEMNRLKIGQSLYLAEIDEQGRSKNSETIFIGDATPYTQPTTASEEGWDYNHPRMKKFVLEIREYK